MSHADTRCCHLIRLSLLLLSALILLSSACRDEDEVSDRVDHASGPADVILRVDDLPDAAADQSSPPMFALYGDGSAISPVANQTGSPGPVLPDMKIVRLNEDGIQEVLRAALAAGLLAGDQTYQGLASKDLVTTRFTLHADGRETTVDVTGLGTETAANDLDAGERAARQDLTALRAELNDLATWLSTGLIVSQEPYQPARLQLIVQAVDHIQPGPNAPQPLAWPLTVSPDTFGTPTVLQAARCGVIEGSDIEQALNALRQASFETRWDYHGTPFTIRPRILLPDDVPCPGPVS